MGDSIAAGWGVNVDDRFESILERALGRAVAARGRAAVEVLDTAVPGHAPGQRWHHFQRVGWPMRPDLVICESTEADVGWDERRLRYVLARGQGFDSPLYRDVLAAAGVAPGWSPDEYKHALHPYHREVLAGAYRAMAADGAARGVPIIWVLIPRVGKPTDPAQHDAILAMARSAGFAHVVNASDAYDGLDPARLAVEPDDFHPNAAGHARLAHRLDEALGRPARAGATLEARAREPSGPVLVLLATSAPRSPTPMIHQSTCTPAARAAVLHPLLLLVAGMVSWPAEWDCVHAVLDCAAFARSRAPPTARRHAVGYYVKLIEGSSGAGSRGATRPEGWIGFREADVIRYLDDDFLLFELKPDIRRTLFGQPFETNAYGMHDDPVARGEARGDVPHRRAGRLDGHGLGRAISGHVHQPARATGWTTARQPGSPAGRGGTRSSTSPSPPTARSSGSRPCGARCWPSSPTW